MSSHFTRREMLTAGMTAIGGGLAGCSDGSETPTTSETVDASETPSTPSETATTETDEAPSEPEEGALPGSVGVEQIADGFTAPVGVEFLPNDDVLLVADQVGTIHVVSGGTVRDEPLIDLRDRMVDVSGYEERGLLGFALPPDYPADDRLFVRYSAPPQPGTPEGYSHTFALSSFTLDTDALLAAPDTEQRILELPEPQTNHNAGAIEFGPEEHLYVAVGDGGGADDTGNGHVSDWYDANAGGNGQDVTENLLGGILRIDVTDTGDEPYQIPADNPLVGRDGRSEYYAWGLRNPWRMAFHDGELYAADVGQGRFEEVNHVTNGGNYGWNVREGTQCFSPGSSADACPTETPDGEPLLDPVIEYPHSGQPVSGVAVIGGQFYAGESIPGLRDRYLFADWQADGTLFVGTPTEDGLWETTTLPVDDDSFGSLVLAFGRDGAGEIYVCTSDRGQLVGSTGAVCRLTQA
ncbi:PQQ-dependent sugar dehydrogenase [Halorhabdus sp. BNX81]|uniref:PQQ-dependent sugar dehydrogenase n=1 Tax=Halorhabdus sp. BNX81 TaxID=2980181 RepID=UPI0023DD610D|nr:PQQ-dependent sugar dehydrogenase [Halorhabdus sp. BNX81]WEL21507.1 Glucose/sorbosone dehydrogenase [Halorhabdus sp. BNX81]